jgi:hypothetical protein
MSKAMMHGWRQEVQSCHLEIRREEPWRPKHRWKGSMY